MQRNDWLLVAASGAALALFLVSQAAGWAAGWYAYPTLTAPSIDARPLAACLLLFTPVLIWRSRS
jgi:heme/copper-type cytochrome/quinol oxidase subunit 1